MNKLDLVIVIPVGPDTPVDYACDTISSISHYINCSYKIIIIDDSQQAIGLKINNRFPDVDLISTQKNNGRLCGLYLTLAFAYKYAVNNYNFRLLFKVDTDALIINDNPQTEAFDLFNNDSSIGMAGQYPKQYNGKPWDISWPEDRIQRDLCSWKIIRNFHATITLRKWYLKALKNGYRKGESVFGGSYFISYECLKKLDNQRLLPLNRLRKIRLEEDHLFSMLVKANGFNLGDLSSGNLPFACEWRGLPASPEELYSSGKKVIHSTRFWKNQKEATIRNYFKYKRVMQTA